MMQVTIMDIGKKAKIGAAESAKIFDFCMERSEQIVLCRDHQEKIPQAILEQRIGEAAEKIIVERERELAYINERTDKELQQDGFLSREQAVEIIHQQADARLEVLKVHAEVVFTEDDTLEADLADTGLVKRELSLGSFTTDGPWFDLCWFDKYVLQLDQVEADIFSFPMEIAGYEMMDPCFAKGDGTVWARISSHERTITLDLSEEDYQVFCTLGIDHNVYPPREKGFQPKKALIVGAISAASILGAALGVTLSVKKRKKTNDKEFVKNPQKN